MSGVTRVLVVGAGHTGLVAAIHLAARGLDVTVLEHAATPGGATSSGEVTLPGFVHDHCAAFAPMAVRRPAMRELELDVDWIDPPVVMAHPFDDGSAIALHRDAAATAASLGPAGAGWAAAMERMLPQARPAGRGDPRAAAAGARRAAARAGAAAAPRRAGRRRFLAVRRGARAGRCSTATAGDRVAGGVGAARRPAADHGGERRVRLPAAAASGQSHGWPFPRTGMQALADALARRAAAHGAQRALHGARSSRSWCAAAASTGVRLAGGEEVAADAVAHHGQRGRARAAAARRRAARAAAAAARALALRDRARSRSTTRSPARCRGRPPRRASAGVVHVGRRAARAGCAPRPPGGAARCRSVPRWSSASSRCTTRRARRRASTRSTSTATCRTATTCPTTRSPRASRRSSSASRPGSRALVLAARSARRAQTERENPSLVGGDLGGGAMELDQSSSSGPRRACAATGRRCAACTSPARRSHPGPPVHGMTGRSAARALLARPQVRSSGGRRDV